MKKKNVTFVITEELDRRIEIQAALDGMKKSELLMAALNDFLPPHPILKSSRKSTEASPSQSYPNQPSA